MKKSVCSDNRVLISLKSKISVHKWLSFSNNYFLATIYVYEKIQICFFIITDICIHISHYFILFLRLAVFFFFFHEWMLETYSRNLIIYLEIASPTPYSFVVDLHSIIESSLCTLYNNANQSKFSYLLFSF